MPKKITNFGYVDSPVGQAAICTVVNPGPKNALAVVVSYAPAVGTLALPNLASFWGRLTVYREEIDNGVEIFHETQPASGARPIFDVRWNGSMDHQFLFPIAELQGSASSSSASSISVVAHAGIDAIAGSVYRCFLNVAGVVKSGLFYKE